MSEQASRFEGCSGEAEVEKNRLLQHVTELEKEIMKMKRAEKVLGEVEQRYLALIDSSFFLCVILAPDGKFRAMNRRAEEFFGFRMRHGMNVTLQSLAGHGCATEIESMLKGAMEKPHHAALSVVCADKATYWLNMECSRVIYHGDTSIQVLASDITELMKGKTNRDLAGREPEPNPVYALQALNSCPGLLCFVVDKNSVLLYSSRGYREITKRFLGHECVVGLPYPIGIDTPFDLDLQDLIQEALLGNTTLVGLVETGENKNRWNVTGAPLVSSTGTITGAVINLTPTDGRAKSPPQEAAPQKRSACPGATPKEHEKKEQDTGSPGFSQSQAKLLNSIPRMIFVVDDNACCVDANADFLNAMKLTRDEVVGHSFEEFLLKGDSINENMAADFIRAVRRRIFRESGVQGIDQRRGRPLIGTQRNARAMGRQDLHAGQLRGQHQVAAN